MNISKEKEVGIKKDIHESIDYILIMSKKRCDKFI